MRRSFQVIRQNASGLAVMPLLLWASVCLGADPVPNTEGLDFFERHIRPLLIEHCHECHSEAHKIKGGLRLDLRRGWEKGGDTGRAIEPGSPEKSLLLEAVQYGNPDLEMPPKGPLSSAEIDVIETWIRMGAPDPREGSMTPNKQEGMDLETGRQFWSFRPIEKTSLPHVRNRDWSHTGVDNFILAKLEDHDMQVAGDARPRDLLRRVCLDLTGLPPSPEEIHAFESAPSRQHYRAVVDRLMGSRAFGEKWGRHWLDLARYAESTGGGRSSVLANAWRYRNYVIDAYNEDKPVNQFIQEQIAGDLMDWTFPDERHDQLVATAFLAIGPKNLDLQDKELLRMNTVDEQIDTIGRSLLGMTLGCARCHAHKFDPVPMEDYYALAGILRSTRTLVRDNVSKLVEQELPVSPEHHSAYTSHTQAVKKLENQLKKIKAAKPSDPEEINALKALELELTGLRKSAPAPLPKAISVDDEKDAGDYAICIRGNVHQLGETVQRGFMRVMLPKGQPAPRIRDGESGRLELAEWLVGHASPLTARVYVNRLWHHLFGRGIVPSVDNFGTTGDTPSHPELLDYLAGRFMEKDWSTKQALRQMVLSRTYQLAVSDRRPNREKDPNNALRSSMDRRRLPAEAIRDTILMASGRMRHGHIQSMLPGEAATDSALRNAKLEYTSLVQPMVRSVYIPVFREEGRNALLDAFDFANPSFTVGRRIPGVRPTQSLYLMNNPWVMEQATAAAERLLSQHGQEGQRKKLELAYRWTLSRPPRVEEYGTALAYLELPENRTHPVLAWTGIYHALFSCVDFLYLQ
jgi:hypothetical protein